MTGVLSDLAANQSAALTEALSDAYPWVQFLPPDERELFAAELREHLLAADSIGDFMAAAQFLHEWKATAEIHADPELARRLAGPHEITHGGRVPPPVV